MVMQAEAGTAEGQVDNGAVLVEATEAVAPAEAADEPVAEAVPETTTETTQPEPEATPEAPADPLASLSEDALRDHPTIKSLLARENESVRQRAENDTQRRIAEREQQWLSQGEYVDDLRKAIVLNDDGNPVFDSKAAAQVADKMWSAGVRQLVDIAAPLLDANVPDDFAITRAEQRALEDAQAKYIADPVMHGDVYLKARLAIHDRAVIEAAKPALRKEIEAEVRADIAAKAKTDSIRTADETRKASTNPTATSGAAGRQWASQLEMKAAHVRGEISTEDMIQAHMDGTLAALPPE